MRSASCCTKDPRVDVVSFTGSTATGQARDGVNAPDTVKRVFLELGGKSAFIVLDDADLEGACATAAFTVRTHAGQGCAITTRLLVPRTQLRRLRRRDRGDARRRSAAATRPIPGRCAAR